MRERKTRKERKEAERHSTNNNFTPVSQHLRQAHYFDSPNAGH